MIHPAFRNPSGPKTDRSTQPSSITRKRTTVLSLLAIALVALATAFGAGAQPASAAVTFTVQPSLEQLYVTHAAPGSTASLLDASNAVVDTVTVDAVGSAVFREVSPGSGYTVRIGAEESDPVMVAALAGPPPPQGFYSGQTLNEGFQYITMRDGTKLAARVFLPGPPEDGPYPTVIEYSGYNPAAPDVPIADSLGLDQAARDSLCPDLPVICKTPAQPGSKLAYAFDFAVVAVNVRGTGCSGGPFDYFEELQRLDGYDVIETVAAQPWVKNNKVGMIGLSYAGLSQLFVAPLQPPSLAAIAPMSVFDDTARGILAPGGMYNEGFAFTWVDLVLNEAQPYGQGWEQAEVDNGDTQCAENQLLRSFNVNAVEKARQYPYYVADPGDDFNLALQAPAIEVPVFMTGAWQDEQTGGRFPLLWNQLTRAPFKRLYGYNGLHADGYSPQILTEWKAFLDIYLDGSVRQINPFITGFGGSIFEGTFGVPLSFPLQRWLTAGTFAETKAKFEAEPGYWIILERGRGPEFGAPEGGVTLKYDSWPPPGMEPQRWFFQPDGSLSQTAPAAIAGTSQFTQKPEHSATTTFSGDVGAIFHALPDWNWPQVEPSSSVVYQTAPLTEDSAFIGTGSVDLRFKTSANDAEFEVTLSELRPDGTEMLVQNGWLRASQKALLAESTETMPLLSNYESDNSLATPGEWTDARVLIFPFAHVFRAGSQIRVSVHSPGGNMARWTLETKPELDGSTVDIGHNSVQPSSVVLPLVAIPKWYEPTVPRCPSLRGQPCRPVEAFTNRLGEATQMPTTTTSAPATTSAPTTISAPITTAPANTTTPVPPAKPRPIPPSYTG